MKTNETYEKARFYFNKKQAVHITLLNDNWLNGIILNVNEDFKDRLVLIEEKFGEMLVLFSEIKSILPREERE
jgi:hypothetical protein